jgi:hypothetical protein
MERFGNQMLLAVETSSKHKSWGNIIFKLL